MVDEKIWNFLVDNSLKCAKFSCLHKEKILEYIAQNL